MITRGEQSYTLNGPHISKHGFKCHICRIEPSIEPDTNISRCTGLRLTRSSQLAAHILQRSIWQEKVYSIRDTSSANLLDFSKEQKSRMPMSWYISRSHRNSVMRDSRNFPKIKNTFMQKSRDFSKMRYEELIFANAQQFFENATTTCCV